jgi:hypothetical protein
MGRSSFGGSVLATILIPQSVEVLCGECFSNCKSLISVAFESPSKLRGTEARVFSGGPATDHIVLFAEGIGVRSGDMGTRS